MKTGALGDVLRTTSILPGLRKRYPDARITWVVARGGEDLLRFHSDVASVVAIDPNDPASLARAREELGRVNWSRVISLEDEEPLCELATALGGRGENGVLSGAFVAREGKLGYTPDTSLWFDMGLISVFGKSEADRLKKENRASHPAIFARMLGVEMGEPVLPLPSSARAFARAFANRTGLHDAGPVIGMNTGAGGRWESKKLPIERTVALMQEISRRRTGRVTFLLLGGRDEGQRNRTIRQEAENSVRLVDGGVENALLDFAGLVSRVDLLVTSDSLALHLAISQRVPVVVFFAPTSACEIELYGRGEKVESLAADACSYRSDADTSTLTVERLASAVERVLTSRPSERAPRSART